MSLITNIQSICENLIAPGTFKLASKFKASRESFDIATANLPLVILDNELPKDGEIAKNNNFLENTRIVISVLTFDDPLNDDVAQNALVEAMEVIARKIIFNIYKLNYIKPVNNTQTYTLSPAFNVYVSSLSGCLIDMRVRVDLVQNVCLND